MDAQIAAGLRADLCGWIGGTSNRPHQVATMLALKLGWPTSLFFGFLLPLACNGVSACSKTCFRPGWRLSREQRSDMTFMSASNQIGWHSLSIDSYLLKLRACC